MSRSIAPAVEAAVAPAACESARLMQEFAEFLLSRASLLAALRAPENGVVRGALRDACVRFHQLATGLMPGTPEDILSALTKNVVLNVCRAAGALETIEALSGGRAAKIVDGPRPRAKRKETQP